MVIMVTTLLPANVLLPPQEHHPSLCRAQHVIQLGERRQYGIVEEEEEWKKVNLFGETTPMSSPQYSLCGRNFS